MLYTELNSELRGFCKQLIDDGYTKSQICNILLGQQKLPMFSSFIENEDRNFGIGVLSQIFEIFGYDLMVIPVLRDSEESPKITDLKNKFIQNYRVMLTEGLANQKNEENKKSTKVQQAIKDVAIDLFQQITQR